MPFRLANLEVQEVSLVDNPAVPDARYLITKRRSEVPTPPMTEQPETIFERVGKAVMDMLGAAPADETTRRAIVKAAAEAQLEADADDADDTEDTNDSDDADDADDAPADDADAADDADDADDADAADDADDAPVDDAPADDADTPTVDPDALKAAFTEVLDEALAPLREAVGKSLDANTEVAERVAALEKARGKSKVAKGAEQESSSDASVFGSAIFGGL